MDNLVCLFVKEGEIVIDLPFFYVVVNGLAGVVVQIKVPDILNLSLNILLLILTLLPIVP